MRLDSVRKRFGERCALESLSLALAPGEVYALLGPNGAGKTTTLNLILGFLRPDAGRIEVAGIDAVADPLGARARIAYLPETVMLHPTLSAIENLGYFALLGGRRLDDAQARALLNEAGLQEEAHARRAGGYSKGMRQKVGLAIALAKDARVLLLDEPTSGLDASAANDLSHGVRAAAQRGMAVLMATHDLYRVKDVAQRLGILRDGRLLLEQRTDRLSAAQIEALYLEQLSR
ncbi:ABC transporter ATP-binding protein [Lysobacter silvisoli]|uniref:ABC transporter ATP-binding protein n=1 Tax=Lysobacter silvisoli TaxID=2293254 RepID=A0A371JWU4_9GAMM|nr:ABC transporter ATP-binding protein [Lysobacter silvisoli]